MAEIHIPNNRADLVLWQNELSDLLPEAFILVVDLVVQRVPLSAVIVHPHGLIVLHPRDWRGHIVTSASGPWREQTPNGLVGSYINPAVAVREAEQALQRYFRDEFPGLRPIIKHLVVLVNPEADVVEHSPAISALVIRRNDLVREIRAQASITTSLILDRATCEAIATALQDRQFSRNQRATEPFVFRSGSLLGTDRRAWTLQQVFRHMDRYPIDGIYHMRNGTLKQWLIKQDALYMARLVKEALSANDRDPRAALEKLLVKSGLVNPRGIAIRPRNLDFGMVLAGDNQGRSFTMRPLARHGYLVATLETSATWLHVDPQSLMGTAGQVVVRVDTANLPIQDRPYDAQVLLTSPLLATPITLPVHLRVVGEPSRLSRRFLRPLIGLVAAGVIGGVIGMDMGRWGIAPPSWLNDLVPSLSPLAIWGIILSFFWAIWGLVRGLHQPLALPIGTALIRWLASTALWIIPLGLIALTAAWALGILYPLLIIALPAIQITMVLTAVGLAIVPAVMDRRRNLPDYELTSSSRPYARRPLVAMGTAVLLALLVFGGVSFLPSFWQSGSVQVPKTTVTGWAATQLDALRTWINHQTEQYYLNRYDRRAPAQPTTAPEALRPTPAPTK